MSQQIWKAGEENTFWRQPIRSVAYLLCFVCRSLPPMTIIVQHSKTLKQSNWQRSFLFETNSKFNSTLTVLFSSFLIALFFRPCYHGCSHCYSQYYFVTGFTYFEAYVVLGCQIIIVFFYFPSFFFLSTGNPSTLR